MTRPHPAPRRARRRVVTAVAVVVGLVVVTLAAWAVDHGRTDGRTERHLALHGRDIGGLDPAAVDARVAELAEDYEPAAVTIRSPAGTLETTAAAVGLHLDRRATATAALATATDGAGWTAPLRWLRALVRGDAAPLSFRVDRDQFAAGTADLARASAVAPTEPALAVADNTVVAVPPSPGASLDLDDLASRLTAAAATGETPIVVEATTRPVPARFGDADGRALASRANALTRTPLTLAIGGKSATIQSSTVRSWLTARATAGGLELGVDRAAVERDLPPLIGDLGTAPVDASFAVAPGAAGTQSVLIVDGAPGTRCCAPDSVDRIVQALASGQTVATLDLEPVPPGRDRAWAESLGITEPIGTFTTPHACCEPRVTNIHRIADIVRGTVIEPGQQLSVNQRVGERTREKGFVEAPVIYEGTHSSDVGGGVSQFATTLFNAAFFGGLDIVDYQSHSQYISRYPYGREATISWTKPDLVIRNNTPHGILVWPTYTDTSLTVTLYSTRWVSGEQTGQVKEDKGVCDKVTTTRTRTYAGDGHTDTDTFVAFYQHADGVKCF